jgi:hypothetical protein
MLKNSFLESAKTMARGLKVWALKFKVQSSLVQKCV